jgi:hypothetical protein
MRFLSLLAIQSVLTLVRHFVVLALNDFCLLLKHGLLGLNLLVALLKAFEDGLKLVRNLLRLYRHSI